MIPTSTGSGLFDWSPDGKSIAVGIQRKDKSYQIGLVSVPNGSVRVLKSADWYRDATIVFSPDGQYLAYDVRTQPNTDERAMFVLTVEGTREIPVVVSPGQNGIVGWSRDGKRLLFTSDRTGSVGLWSVPFTGGKVDGPPELLRRNIGPMLSLGLTDADQLYMQVEGANRDVHLAEVDFLTGKQTKPATMAAQTYVGNNQLPA